MRSDVPRSEDDSVDVDVLDTRAEAYLAGALSPAETREFERDLARPDVARALSQAILLRDLLTGDPVLDVPEGLARRLAAQLDLGRDRAVLRRDPSALRSVLGSLAWAWRGPGLAVSELTPDASVSGARAGFSSLRYALGPLALRRGRA